MLQESGIAAINKNLTKRKRSKKISRWKKASGNIQLTKWHCSKLLVLLESVVAAFLLESGIVGTSIKGNVEDLLESDIASTSAVFQ